MEQPNVDQTESTHEVTNVSGVAQKQDFLNWSKMISVSRPGKPEARKEIVVFIDPGSSLSFIKSELTEQLGLVKGDNKSIEIAGVCGNVSRSISNDVEVNVQLKSGKLALIAASTVDKITMSYPVAVNYSNKWEKLENWNIGHNVVQREPDILIGLPDFEKIQLQMSPKILSNGLKAYDSAIGFLLCGMIPGKQMKSERSILSASTQVVNSKIESEQLKVPLMAKTRPGSIRSVISRSRPINSERKSIEIQVIKPKLKPKEKILNGSHTAKSSNGWAGRSQPHNDIRSADMEMKRKLHSNRINNKHKRASFNQNFPHLLESPKSVMAPSSQIVNLSTNQHVPQWSKSPKSAMLQSLESSKSVMLQSTQNVNVSTNRYQRAYFPMFRAHQAHSSSGRSVAHASFS